MIFDSLKMTEHPPNLDFTQTNFPPLFLT